MKTPNKKTALEELAEHLRWLHPNYTIDDVRPSEVRGYLKCTRPCPGRKDWADHWYCGAAKGPYNTPHYHTIDIAGRPQFVCGNYSRGKYAFWRAVCQELKEKDGGNQSNA